MELPLLKQELSFKSQNQALENHFESPISPPYYQNNSLNNSNSSQEISDNSMNSSSLSDLEKADIATQNEDNNDQSFELTQALNESKIREQQLISKFQKESEKNKKLQRSCDEIAQKYNALLDVHGAAQKTSTDQKISLTQQNEELKQLLADANGIMKKLNESNKSLKKKVNYLETKNQKYASALKQAQIDIENDKIQFKILLNSKTQSFQEQLKQKEEIIENLNEQINTLQTEKDGHLLEVEQKAAYLETTVKNLQSKALEKEKEILNYQLQIEELNHTIQNLQDELEIKKQNEFHISQIIGNSEIHE